MTKTAVQDRKIPLLGEIISQARGFIFTNEPARAIALLAEYCDSPDLPYSKVFDINAARWLGIAQMSAGDFVQAKQTLTACLVRRDQSATGPLAAVQRILGESTAWLFELPELELEGFEKAFWEKEFACAYWQKEDYISATHWLERAWSSARASDYGHGIYPAIAQLLGQCLRILGNDSRAVHVLDVGIKHVQASRRAPLLFERGIANFNLMRLAAVEDDLADLKMQPSIYSTYAIFLEACLYHARGNFAEAFNLYQTARESGHKDMNDELVFYANLYASQARIEMNLLECNDVDVTDPKFIVGADNFLWQAEEVAFSNRQKNWLALYKGIWNVRVGNHDEVSYETTWTLGQFRSDGMLREACITALVQVENQLSQGKTYSISNLLGLVAQMVMEMGGSSALIMPMRLLPLTSAHLAALPATSELRLILSEPNAFKELHVFADRLEIDGARIRTKRSKSVDLIRFMAGFESGLLLEEIVSQFFIGSDHDNAKSLFHLLRKDIKDSVPGISILLSPKNNRYTLSRTQFRIVVKS